MVQAPAAAVQTPGPDSPQVPGAVAQYKVLRHQQSEFVVHGIS